MYIHIGLHTGEHITITLLKFGLYGCFWRVALASSDWSHGEREIAHWFQGNQTSQKLCQGFFKIPITTAPRTTGIMVIIPQELHLFAELKHHTHNALETCPLNDIKTIPNDEWYPKAPPEDLVGNAQNRVTKGTGRHQKMCNRVIACT